MQSLKAKIVSVNLKISIITKLQGPFISGIPILANFQFLLRIKSSKYKKRKMKMQVMVEPLSMNLNGFQLSCKFHLLPGLFSFHPLSLGL